MEELVIWLNHYAIHKGLLLLQIIISNIIIIIIIKSLLLLLSTVNKAVWYLIVYSS